MLTSHTHTHTHTYALDDCVLAMPLINEVPVMRRVKKNNNVKLEKKINR